MSGGVNHRELLAVLDRQATRVNALEAGLARPERAHEEVALRFPDLTTQPRESESTRAQAPAAIRARGDARPPGRSIPAHGITGSEQATRAVHNTHNNKRKQVEV